MAEGNHGGHGNHGSRRGSLPHGRLQSPQHHGGIHRVLTTRMGEQPLVLDAGRRAERGVPPVAEAAAEATILRDDRDDRDDDDDDDHPCSGGNQLPKGFLTIPPARTRPRKTPKYRRDPVDRQSRAHPLTVDSPTVGESGRGRRCCRSRPSPGFAGSPPQSVEVFPAAARAGSDLTFAIGRSPGGRECGATIAVPLDFTLGRA